MGYHTYFNLQVTDDPEDKIIEKFREENLDARHALTETGYASDGCTWYDVSDDLKEFSAKHPGHLFTMYGEGEEANDLWVMYAKDGKCTDELPATITYPKFEDSENQMI